MAVMRGTILSKPRMVLYPDDFSRHESEEMLVAALPAIIDQEGGDVNRVMLMGFCQGAAVIYSLLMVYDLRNYGITPIASINMSGYIPTRYSGSNIREAKFDGSPQASFFFSHGEFDELIPMQALGEAEKLLTRQGADVTARMYPVGHGVLPETVEDIISWMKLRISNYELRNMCYEHFLPTSLRGGITKRSAVIPTKQSVGIPRIASSQPSLRCLIAPSQFQYILCALYQLIRNS